MPKGGPCLNGKLLGKDEMTGECHAKLKRIMCQWELIGEELVRPFLNGKILGESFYDWLVTCQAKEDHVSMESYWG